MGQEKTIAKLCSTPPPANLKWRELRAVVIHFGYKELSGSGSRRKFFHGEKNALIILHAPHPSPDVDKGCIADVVAHLKEHGFIS
jgi:hypothetical protein